MKSDHSSIHSIGQFISNQLSNEQTPLLPIASCTPRVSKFLLGPSYAKLFRPPSNEDVDPTETRVEKNNPLGFMRDVRYYLHTREIYGDLGFCEFYSFQRRGKFAVR